jgi:hypothetical protein
MYGFDTLIYVIQYSYKEFPNKIQKEYYTDIHDARIAKNELEKVFSNVNLAVYTFKDKL